MLRLLSCVLCVSVLTFAGCAEPIELSERENTGAPAETEPATTSETPAAESNLTPPATEAPAAESADTPEPAPAPQETPKPKKGVIGQTTAQVVDAKEWLQKPGIQAKDGKIEGVDPFSRTASGYFTLAAQTSTLGLQQAVQHYKALNDKFPPYEEFMRMMQENRIEFTKLRWYEIYAYNEDTGKILVLEDTVAKEEGP